MWVKCDTCRLAFHTVDDWTTGQRLPTRSACPKCAGPVRETTTIYWSHPEVNACMDQRAAINRRLNVAKALYGWLYEELDLTRCSDGVREKAYQLYLYLVLGGVESGMDAAEENERERTGTDTRIA